MGWRLGADGGGERRVARGAMRIDYELAGARRRCDRGRGCAALSRLPNARVWALPEGGAAAKGGLAGAAARRELVGRGQGRRKKGERRCARGAMRIDDEVARARRLLVAAGGGGALSRLPNARVWALPGVGAAANGGVWRARLRGANWLDANRDGESANGFCSGLAYGAGWCAARTDWTRNRVGESANGFCSGLAYGAGWGAGRTGWTRAGPAKEG